MQTLDLVLSGTSVSLRLTASKLQQFIKDHGNEAQSPLLAVLDAVDSLKRKAALFTAALQFKDNHNTVKDGFELLDLLADEGYTPFQTQELVVKLSVMSGLVAEEDAETVLDSIEKGNKRFINTVAQVLSGDVENQAPAEAAAPGEAKAENPT